ncbi:nuclear transport factor 2 [Olea europaea subsp. europaea]|uniref:Nuclear transport factor 2 n=1 Tax=Olea europaea subsp. europaea TaxID=158383 RepID=A0A8S0QDL2_OLEEU|nr:nuclear transport factor 2 [Olea europaea subsp. europaea]
MDPDALSKAFVEHYYSTFDANRAALAGLYQEASMLTFEGQKIQGAQNITDKLAGLPFQQCQHQITTVDCQPSGPAGGMIVFVSGNLLLAGEQHPLKFSQIMHIEMGNSKHIIDAKIDDVPFDADTSGKLLRVERPLSLELCMRMWIGDIFRLKHLFGNET